MPTFQEIRELEILKEIEQGGGEVTQRDLSTRLGVALGLVNAFLKRLVRKGCIKVTTLPARRIRYLLTPHGLAQKTRLTFEYIEYSYRFLRDARERARKVFEEVRRGGGRRVVFHGVSEIAELAYLSLKESGLTLAAVVDPDPRGRRFMGKAVLGPEALAETKFDALIITGPVPEAALRSGRPVYRLTG